MNCITKIVVFDMDETLGYFIELGMFWDAMSGYIKNAKLNIRINQELFNKVLDLFPEFLRPNIINILGYLKNKKQKKNCEKLMIYTNNKGPEEWAHYIMKYFDDKLNYKIFDQIIAAFKVNGKHVELCRTTHMKTFNDFTKCTKVPETTQICFLDDVYYPGMGKDNIYYINIKPYVYDLTFEEMINRLIKSGILGKDISGKDISGKEISGKDISGKDISGKEISGKEISEKEILCKEFILDYMKRYNYTHVPKSSISQSVDKALSKKIMHHLELFFNKHKGNSLKTRKKKIYKIKTMKKRSV